MIMRCSPVLAALAAMLTAPVFLPAGEEPRPRSGVDSTGFDLKVRPQDDFFRYVNGAWLAHTEIPSDRSRFGSFIILADKSEASLRRIIEDAAASHAAPDGSDTRKVGDLYRSFMDEQRVEMLDKKPIENEISAIAQIKDKKALQLEIARLQRDGVASLVGAFVSPDAKKSDTNILYLNQSGISLPDEAYYRDPRHKAIREKFVSHVEKMLSMIGMANPKKAAETVMALETEIARSHWDRVKNRDRLATYNKMDRAKLAELAPQIDWSSWLETLGAGSAEQVVVRQPSYLTGLSKVLESHSLDDFKTWLTWQVVSDAAPLLSNRFVKESFEFREKTLTGTPELRPRWKRGVRFVEAAMGEAVGKIFVEKHFPPAAKERMKELVKNLIEAYRENISNLEWMSPETRTKALAKLEKFNPKIGYPDEWRDYSGLKVSSTDLVENGRNAARFEFDWRMGKLKKPVDRKEWHMTPQTVNAYYNPSMNEIVFPAAILQPPFFDLNADDAVNYGAIGAVIGHEIGHGFDDQGSRSDGDGNLVNWWTEEDRKKFESRTRALIEQYSAFEPKQLPGQKVNGALTIGENIGDLGGLSIALKAYQRSLGGKPAPVIDGLKAEQRFFIGWAQAWRLKSRDAAMAQALATDPHSPAEFRCNGVVRNLPEFYQAFGVREGDKMWLAPTSRVRIW